MARYLTLVLALAGALLFSVAPASASDPVNPPLTPEAEIAALQQEIAALRARLDASAPLAPAPAIVEAGAAAAALAAFEGRIEELERELMELRAKVQEQEHETERIDVLEKKAALDRLNITGEIRVASDLLNGTQAGHFDGLKLQARSRSPAVRSTRHRFTRPSGITSPRITPITCCSPTG
jgi:TolA-binding protein